MPDIFKLNDDAVFDPTTFAGTTAIRLPDCPFPIENKMILRAGMQADEAWLSVPETIADNLKSSSGTQSIWVGNTETKGWYCKSRHKIFAGQVPIYVLHFVDRRGLVLDSPADTSIDIPQIVQDHGSSSLDKLIDKIFELHFKTTEAIDKPTPTPVPTNTKPTEVKVTDKTVGQLLQIVIDHYPGVLLRDPLSDTYSLSSVIKETTESETKFLATHQNGLMPDARVRTCRISDGQSKGLIKHVSFGGEVHYHVMIDTIGQGISYDTFAHNIRYLKNRASSLKIIPGYRWRKPSATFNEITYRRQTTTIAVSVMPRISYHVSSGDAVGGGPTIILATCDTDVDVTAWEFIATWQGTDVGDDDGPWKDESNKVTVKNIPVTSSAGGAADFVFDLLKGATFVAYLCDDGKFRILQAAAAAGPFTIPPNPPA